MTADDPLTMLAAGEAFYAGALARITRLMLVLAVLSAGQYGGNTAGAWPWDLSAAAPLHI